MADKDNFKDNYIVENDNNNDNYIAENDNYMVENEALIPHVKKTDEVNPDSVNLNRVNTDIANLDRVNLDSVNSDVENLDRVNPYSVNPNTVRIESIFIFLIFFCAIFLHIIIMKSQITSPHDKSDIIRNRIKDQLAEQLIDISSVDFELAKSLDNNISIYRSTEAIFYDGQYVNYWMVTTAIRSFITYHISTDFMIETYFMPDD